MGSGPGSQKKSGIANIIGRPHRELPRKIDLASISHERLLSLVRCYDHAQKKKCLNYKTPTEVFYREILRVKYDCTERLRGKADEKKVGRELMLTESFG